MVSLAFFTKGSASASILSLNDESAKLNQKKKQFELGSRLTVVLVAESENPTAAAAVADDDET